MTNEVRSESDDIALRLAIEYTQVDGWCTHSEAARDAAKTAIRWCAKRLHVHPQFNSAVERVEKLNCLIADDYMTMHGLVNRDDKEPNQ